MGTFQSCRASCLIGLHFKRFVVGHFQNDYTVLAVIDEINPVIEVSTSVHQGTNSDSSKCPSHRRSTAHDSDPAEQDEGGRHLNACVFDEASPQIIKLIEPSPFLWFLVSMPYPVQSLMSDRL